MVIGREGGNCMIGREVEGSCSIKILIEAGLCKYF